MSFIRFVFLVVISLASHAAQAAAPRVLVSLKPIHSLVAGVMAGVEKPELLLDGAQSPHDFTLRPSDRRKIEAAELVVWVGEAMETPLAGVLKGRPVLTLMDVPGMDSSVAAPEGAETGHEGHDDPHHHDRDPHIWMSTRNAALIVERLVTELSRRDPANEATYRANGEQLRARIEQLEQELAARMAPLRGIPYLVFHDGYGLFERHHGLNHRGAVTLSPERPPGARRVAELRQQIIDEQIRCLFREPQFPPKLADTLIAGTPARQGVLDPLGADLPAGPEAYFQLMRSLATGFATCLMP